MKLYEITEEAIMAKNPVQFQKGLGLYEFLEDYGSEEQCREDGCESHARRIAGGMSPCDGPVRPVTTSPFQPLSPAQDFL